MNTTEHRPPAQAKIQTTNGVGTQMDAMGTTEGVKAIGLKPYKPWGTKVECDPNPRGMRVIAKIWRHGARSAATRARNGRAPIRNHGHQA